MTRTNCVLDRSDKNCPILTEIDVVVAPTLNTWILIGQKICRFELIQLAYKETQVRKIYGRERLGAKRSKDLQNGTHDGTIFALVECDMLTPAVGRPLEICPKK